MKKSILVPLFFLLTFNSFSQERPPELQQSLDSLWRVWENTKQPDSTRIRALNNFVWDGYLFIQTDSAQYYAQLAYDFAESKDLKKEMAATSNLQGVVFTVKGDLPKALDYYQQSLSIQNELGNKYGIAAALSNMGIIYEHQGDYTKALEYYHQSLAIHEELGIKEGMVNALLNIGSIYSGQGNYPEALEYYRQSLEIYEELEDKEGISSSLNNIGSVYQLQSNYPKALEHYQKSLAIYEKLGNKKGILSTLLNIGNIYTSQNNTLRALEYYQRSLVMSEELGDNISMCTALSNIGATYEILKDYSKAIEYLQKGLLKSKELGDKATVASAECNIGVAYRGEGNYTKALEHFQQSLMLYKELGAQSRIATLLSNIGVVYIQHGNYPKAIEFCKNSFELAKNIEILDEQKKACDCLYDSYKSMGNTQKALDYYEQSVVLKDSMFNEENTKKLTQLEMQYEFDKKEAATQAEQEKKDAIAAQELERQKLVRNGFMGGFAVVLLFAGVFFIQRNKIGKEKERSENLLLNILPAEVAEELKEKGESEAKNFDEVSVIFTDFKSFTQTAEKLNAKELVNEINTCFKAFDAITEKYNIEKIKTIGDAYMAAGGLNTPRKSEAKDVVKAALEMQAFMLNHQAEKLKTGSAAFEMRVGVHTGPVVAGIVGVKKFQYDIWGDTVNTASRMESNSEVGKVNISEATYDYLKNDPDFVFESRGKINAKGKGEIEMYFVSMS